MDLLPFSADNGLRSFGISILHAGEKKPANAPFFVVIKASMTRCIIFLFIGFFLGAFVPAADAQVRVNKGPAFLLRRHPTRTGRQTQMGLLEQYVAWNAANEIVNTGFRTSAAAAARRFAESPFQLQPADLTQSFLSFGYKDALGIYHDWEFVETKFGYCHGMTMVTRNFAYFAKFDPTQSEPYVYAKNPEEWLAFYRKRVDAIMRDETAVIPGFRSLIDFSKSAIGEYLARHVADQWALNTGRVSSYRYIYEKNFKAIADRGELEALRMKIQFYLEHGFYPRIVLGSGRYKVTDPHVVMVTDLAPPASVNDACLVIGFFNVGANSGGHPDAFRICVGDRTWIPNDEDTYLYDFARELIPINLN